MSRRAIASSLASASALSCSFCRDCRSSTVVLSAASLSCLSCTASSPALLDSASCVSRSRRAFASSPVSAAALSCSVFKDCRSDAVAFSAA